MIARLAIACASCLVAAAPAAAQDRIAYANVETILSLMPETRAAAAGVDSLGRRLSKDLQVKEAYAQKKVEEARAAQASGATEATLDKFRSELQGLEEEIRRDAEKADERIAAHRDSVLKPVLEKLETHIQAVAKAEGYTFVLNAVDGDGNSIVLYGEETRDITKKVLEHMGVPVPAKADAASKPGDAPKAGEAKTPPRKGK